MQVSAPLVFVGHGLVSKKFGRDDLKDVDLKGKIAVCIEGRPADVTVEKWAEISADANLLGTLLARGIAGLISIPNGREPPARTSSSTRRRAASSACRRRPRRARSR